MFVKVEPTGCCERKGLVQVRFSMYLDKGDYDFERYHVQVPEREPTEEELADPKRLEEIPKVWRVNPFHNHFVFVEPDIADEEIMDIGRAFLEEAYIKWASGEKRDLKNPSVKYPASVDSARLSACDAKIQSLKNNILESSP